MAATRWPMTSTSLSCFDDREEERMRRRFLELLVLIGMMLLTGLTSSFAAADCGDGMGGGGQNSIGDYRYPDGWRLGYVEANKTYSYGNICKCTTGCIWKVTGSGFSIDQSGNLTSGACGEFMITASCDKGQTYVAGSVGYWLYYTLCTNGLSDCSGKIDHTIKYFGNVRIRNHTYCGSIHIPLPSCDYDGHTYTAEILGNPCANAKDSCSKILNAHFDIDRWHTTLCH